MEGYVLKVKTDDLEYEIFVGVSANDKETESEAKKELLDKVKIYFEDDEIRELCLGKHVLMQIDAVEFTLTTKEEKVYALN